MAAHHMEVILERLNELKEEVTALTTRVTATETQLAEQQEAHAEEIQQLQQQHQEAMQLLQQNAAHAAPRPQRHEANRPRIPPFSGEQGPEAFLEWETRVSEILAVHPIEAGQVIGVITSEFTDYAVMWWARFRQRQIQLNEPAMTTWEQLKTLMACRFVSPQFRRQMVVRLHELRQGNMTVEEYFREAEKLAIYARVDESSEVRMTRFLQGLNTQLRDKIEMLPYTNMQELMHLATMAESQQARKQAVRSFGSVRPVGSSTMIHTPTRGDSVQRGTTSHATSVATPGASSHASNTSRTTPTSTPSASRSVNQGNRRRDIECFKCRGRGHYASECRTQGVILVNDAGEYESDDEEPVADEAVETTPPQLNMGTLIAEEEVYDPAPLSRTLVVQRVLSAGERSDGLQRHNLFHTRFKVMGYDCRIIVDNGSCNNVASKEMVTKLKLPTTPHPRPYRIHWLSAGTEIPVDQQVKVKCQIGRHVDEVLCDVVPMDACHVLLGRPWQFDRKLVYDGHANSVSFVLNDAKIRINSLTTEEVLTHLAQERRNRQQEEATSSPGARKGTEGEQHVILASGGEVERAIKHQQLILCSSSCSTLMSMEVTQILLNAQSVDGTVRKHAEDSLKQFQEQNLPAFLLSLSNELANNDKPMESRKLAGLILKNALDAKEQQRKNELVQRWFVLDGTVKAQIKACLLQTLSSPVVEARSTSSQVIAKIAGIELPHKQWPELIGSLIGNIHQRQPHVKQATLEALGYICEEVPPEALDQDQVNKILTAVVQAMNISEGNQDVRLAATRALYNALGFAAVNFSNDMERDYLMRVVCEATQSSEVKIRLAAFECLVAISSSYYDKLASYMQDVFTITAKAVKEDEESVALQAIEFWSSICDEEIDILDEYSGEFSDDSEIPCFYFIKQALPALVPMLLDTLLKQEEDQDLDEGAWNIAMAGGTCLGLVARTVGDDIVPLVMPFIEVNITKADWRQREAATYAFGSILEGPSPSKLAPIVNVALNFMLSSLMKDPHNHVKDTTAWTLGRIFEFLHGSTGAAPIITSENCQQILTVLLHSMKDVPNVAEKACGALYYLAQGYEDAGSASPLSQFYQEIIQSLLTVTHREDSGESRLRTAAYETLNEVVRCSTDETAPIVMQLVPIVMMELHQTVELQKLASEEKDKQTELQGLLCGCLQVIIQKMGASETTKYTFLQFSDQIMELLLRVFDSRSATVHEEAMLAVGALAYASGANFAKYMIQLYPYLEKGLQNFEEYQVCAITVGVVGDFCRALEDKILPYCDGIMTHLLKDLSSNELHRSVKPPIFSCFGDIALAIGENFEKYLIYAMPMLQSAADMSARVAAADDEMLEYSNQLRCGILEAYSGIFQGFKGSLKIQLLMPYAPLIIQFLDTLYSGRDMDDVVTKTAIGVLGDLADTLGGHAGPLISQSVSCKEFLNECLSSEDTLVRESAEWAKLAISRAVSG